MPPPAVPRHVLMVRLDGKRIVAQAFVNWWQLGVIVDNLLSILTPETVADAEWLAVEAPGVQVAHWPERWA